jgi:hypothetical protein
MRPTVSRRRCSPPSPIRFRQLPTQEEGKLADRFLGGLRFAVAATLAFLVVAWAAYPWVMGDTPFVLDGSNALITCLSNHQYHACGYTGKLNYWGLMSPMGDWPLLQHIPDLIAIGLGASSHAVRTRVLELLNVGGVVASVVAARVVFSRLRQPALFWVFVAVLLSGPILWYARTTSGEVLASGLLVCFIAAVVLPAHPALIGLAAFAATLTKETSYPFVAAVGVLGLVLARRRTGRPIRRELVAGAAGIAVAFVTASLFNVVRFGSILNTNYLDPKLHTPGLGRKLEYAAAVLVSPNGGVFVFWPAAGLLVLAACLVPFLLRRRVDPRPALVIAAVGIGLTAGFGAWWTPFGWFGYGPRLMLPWLLPLVLIALVAYGTELTALIGGLLERRWALVAVLAVVVAFTLPTVGQLWRPNAISAFFEQETPTCQAPWRAGNAAWYGCQHRQMWLDRPMQLYALRGVATPSGVVTSLVVLLGLSGCLLLIRYERRDVRYERRATSTSIQASRARPTY